MSNSLQYARLQREFIDMENRPIEGINATPLADNLLNWDCVIIGPEGTPYENGVFYLDFQISPEYPLEPPKVTFRTKVYHPNIDDSGNICVDILKGNWSSVLTISQVLLSISSLFLDPNPGDPLKPEVARQYMENKDLFNQTAEQWTRHYANT